MISKKIFLSRWLRLKPPNQKPPTKTYRISQSYQIQKVHSQKIFLSRWLRLNTPKSKIPNKNIKISQSYQIWRIHSKPTLPLAEAKSPKTKNHQQKHVKSAKAIRFKKSTRSQKTKNPLSKAERVFYVARRGINTLFSINL